MRYDMAFTVPNYGMVLAYKVNLDNPDAPLEYSHSIQFQANNSKFMIKKDEVTNVTYEEVYALPDASANKVCIVPYPNSGMAWSDRFCWRWASNNELATVCKAYATAKVSDGVVFTGKNIDEVFDTYSITKLVASVIFTRYISDLSQSIQIEDADNPDPYYLCIQSGDIVTWEDVLNSFIIQSDNGCGYIISRRVGYLINPTASSDSVARKAFTDAMQEYVESIGMLNTNIGMVAHALMRSTVADLTRLLIDIQLNNPVITNIWGKLTYTIVAGGANARTWDITSTTNAADREIIPEFVGGKTGSGSTIGGYAWVWRSEKDGELYASALLESTVAHNARFTDARQVINEAYGLTNNA
jgi:D-alanyl-D-alanine carboxypeptidase